MPITNIPYPYTLDRAHDNPPWHMDTIHIQQLYRMCERIRPRVVVEVGSYMGASTSAFVEAMKDGLIEELTCYETCPTVELLGLLDSVDAIGSGANDRLNMEPYPSAPIYADLIFIDADHEHGCPLDVLAALCMGCPHIVLHDHNCINVGLGCRGVADSAKLLQASPLYRWNEDTMKRAGMWTHRGLFYAHRAEVASGWLDGDVV
jgi:hypothetical protein